MALSLSLIEDQISTLERFEVLYGEFLVERRNRDHGWSGAEWARRERELKELAPQAEAAMVAAGTARRWDEGPVRIDLPNRILRFVDRGDGIDDDEQWRIHDELPTHIGALKGRMKRLNTSTSPGSEPRPQTPRHRIVLAWVAEQAGKIAVGVITALIVTGILFVLKGGL
jgi:hypothetical protein